MSEDLNRNALLKSILTRATTDLDFRRHLLVEPDRAILEAFGVRVQSGFRVRFIEKGADLDALIVLPDVHGADELSADDLRAVAGGTDDPPPTDPLWTEPPG